MPFGAWTLHTHTNCFVPGRTIERFWTQTHDAVARRTECVHRCERTPGCESVSVRTQQAHPSSDDCYIGAESNLSNCFPAKTLDALMRQQPSQAAHSVEQGAPPPPPPRPPPAPLEPRPMGDAMCATDECG